MTSQWQVELDDAGRQTETSRGFPTRIAAAIVILVALTLVDATPRMGLDAEFTGQPHTEQRAPSACGAEAVARAQREVNRSPAAKPQRALIDRAGAHKKGHARVAFFVPGN